MNEFYIQYTTDFHLLTALAAIDDLFDAKITCIGPETPMLSRLQESLDFAHYIVDPRTPNISYVKLFHNYLFSHKKENIILVTPFVYPLFTISFLLESKARPAKILRTDEGVGTYASIRHFYNAYRRELKECAKWRCLIRAIFKKSMLNLTNRFKLCENHYIFDSEYNYDLEHVDKIIRNIDLVGKVGSVEGKLIFVTQPNLDENFSTPSSYAEFINDLGVRLGCDSVCVKKHPVDSFDYKSYGFSLMENMPLELFDVKNSVVVGFSSTALLTAKLFGYPKEVYFIDMVNGVLTIDGLSKFNQALFKLYIKPLSVT